MPVRIPARLRHRLLPVLVAALALAARPAAAQESTAGEVQMGGLRVLVHDEQTSAPVPCAHVQIDSAQWLNASIEGALLRPVSPGTHRVTVRARGYEVRSFMVTMGTEPAGMVGVALTPRPYLLDSIHGLRGAHGRAARLLPAGAHQPDGQLHHSRAAGPGVVHPALRT